MDFTKNQRIPGIILLAFLLSILSSFAVAEEDADTELDPDKINWGEDGIYVGLGVYLETPHYVGIDGETTVLPDIVARKGRFFVDGTELGVDLFPWGRVIWTMGFNYNMKQLDVSDADSGSETFYEGLDDRDTSVEWFGLLTFYSDQGIGKLQYYTDVTGTHSGSRAKLSWERKIPGTGNLTVTPGIFGTYHSASYNRYFYGISSDDARVNRPFYDPNNSGEFGVSLLLGYRFESNVGIYLDSSYTWLEEQVKESSMVDNHFKLDSKLSLGYHF